MLDLRSTFTAFVFSFSFAACGSVMSFWDDVNEPGDDVALETCRNRGRAALDGGSSGYRAYDIYEECTYEAGLR